MKWLQAKTNKYWAGARVVIQNALQYPLEFLAPMMTYSLFVFIFTLIWAKAMGPSGEILGYTARDATWYFIIAEISLMAGSGTFGQLSRDIKDGQIAYTLGRPWNFLLFQGVQRISRACFVAILLVIPGLIIGGLTVGLVPAIPPWRLFLVVGSLMLAFLIQYTVHGILALTAFWFEENSAFIFIFTKIALIAGTLMPLEFLPKTWQGVLLWTPFPWFTWAPARLGVVPLTDGFQQVQFIISGQVLCFIVCSLVMALVFSFAEKHTSIQGG